MTASDGQRVMIAQASYGETGAYHQKPGNQTGSELNIREWYSKPWDVCLRPDTTDLADSIATLAEQAVSNPHIGYDQIDRATYWGELQRGDFNPLNITTDCECNCSSFIMANVAAALRYTDGWQWVTTHNLESALLSTGRFSAFHDSSYLTSPDNLRRGDILCKAGSHAVTVIDAPDPQPAEDFDLVTTASVYMREAPIDGNIIKALPPGTGVRLVAAYAWYKVSDGLNTGWVSGRYLQQP